MPRSEKPDRRQRKRSRTLDHITETALGLFEAQGYDSVTMEQIADAADVARRTLYNHFPVKEAVLAHWIHTELAADLARLWPTIERHRTVRARFWRLLNESADWCEAHRAYLPAYLRFRLTSVEPVARPEENASVPGDMVSAFTRLIDEAQRKGEVRSDLAPPHLTMLLYHLYFAALARWLADPRLKLRNEFSTALDVFLNGAAEEEDA